MARYYILTGATSGLGLEAVRKLAADDPDAILIAGARQPASADALRIAVPKERLLIEALDTSSLKSVRSFAESAKTHLAGTPISGLMLNAGVQIVSDKTTSVDGFELTFATNVLGHIALFKQLEDHIDASTVIVSTASGTHDPEHPLAKKYDFQGGFFPSAEAVAHGAYGRADLPGVGLDRYATSKLCNVMFTYGMAREKGKGGPRFIAFDPGMMPGTELARDRSKAIQFAWKRVLPTLLGKSPGVSTPSRSGAVLADLLGGTEAPEGTGLHIEFTRNPIKSSQLSHSEENQSELLAFVASEISKAFQPG